MSLNTQTDAYAPCRALKEHEKLMLKKIREFSHEKSTILDIGCADGLFISELAKELPNAIITGIDISSKLIATAKTKEFKKLTEKLKADSALIVNDKFDENLFLSSRNIKNMEYSDVSSINPVSLMKYEKVIINVESLKIIEERLA